MNATQSGAFAHGSRVQVLSNDAELNETFQVYNSSDYQ